mgnify:CR=1 FL=1
MELRIDKIPNVLGYRFICFADLHLDDYGENINIEPSKFDDRINVLIKIMSYAITNQIGDVYCLGDLFHSRTKIGIDVISKFSNLLDIFVSDFPDVRLIAIKGNHDSHFKDSSFSSILAFKYKNFIPITEITYFKNKKIVAVPFENVPTGLLDEKSEYLFLMHTEFVGASNNGYEVLKSKIFPEMFGGSVVLSGHYHKYQILGNRRNVMYVGTPLQHNFGESGNNTYFWDCLLDYENKILYAEPILLNTAPKYIVITFEELNNISFEQLEGNFVRVLTKKQNYVDATTKVKDIMGKIPVRTLEVSVLEENIENITMISNIKEEKNIDVVEEYLKIMKVENFEEYYTIAQEILDEAKRGI